MNKLAAFLLLLATSGVAFANYPCPAVEDFPVDLFIVNDTLDSFVYETTFQTGGDFDRVFAPPQTLLPSSHANFFACVNTTDIDSGTVVGNIFYKNNTHPGFQIDLSTAVSLQYPGTYYGSYVPILKNISFAGYNTLDPLVTIATAPDVFVILPASHG